MILEELEWWEISLCYKLRDRSLFIAWGGGGDFGGITWFFEEQKGGSVVTAEPKRGDHWKLWKDVEGGPLELALKMKTWGDRESHQMLLGGSLQWSNIQRGDELNFTLFNLKSSPAPAINNDRSLMFVP